MLPHAAIDVNLTEVGVTSSTADRRICSPYGLHRVVEPAGVLPQQAQVLDADPSPYPDEVIVEVQRLNLDAASYRQLREQHGSGDAVRAAVLEIVGARGKMQNPVTGLPPLSRSR